MSTIATIAVTQHFSTWTKFRPVFCVLKRDTFLAHIAMRKDEWSDTRGIESYECQLYEISVPRTATRLRAIHKALLSALQQRFRARSELTFRDQIRSCTRETCRVTFFVRQPGSPIASICSKIALESLFRCSLIFTTPLVPLSAIPSRKKIRDLVSRSLSSIYNFHCGAISSFSECFRESWSISAWMSSR